jgi:hypothetical protein
MGKPARSFDVTIVNELDKDLKLVGSGIDHGIWSDNTDPRQVIRAGESGFCASESKGIATGTEAWVKYNIADWVDFTFRWDNPYMGDNSFSADPAGGYKIDPQIIETGNNAEIKWFVRKSSSMDLRELPIADCA